jgi:hypothetical protein
MLKKSLIIFSIPLFLIISAYISHLFLLQLKTKAQTCSTKTQKNSTIIFSVGIDLCVLVAMIYFTFKAMKDQWAKHKFALIVMMISCMLLIGSVISLIYVLNSVNTLSQTSQEITCVTDQLSWVGKIASLTSVLSGNLFIFGVYFVLESC